MASSPEYPDLQWVPPRSFSPGRPEGPPRFITIHYTAGHEGPNAGEFGADYDQRRTDGTSAHYHVDSDSVVQCVRTTDRSHTALWHGNLWGIHYELAGTVQTRAQWLDAVSRATIRNTARQVARDMARWGIPLARVTGRGVRDPNARGICGHYDWTVGWPEDGGNHTDPGVEFPWDVLFDDISDFMAGAPGSLPALPDLGDDMLLIHHADHDEVYSVDSSGVWQIYAEDLDLFLAAKVKPAEVSGDKAWAWLCERNQGLRQWHPAPVTLADEQLDAIVDALVARVSGQPTTGDPTPVAALADEVAQVTEAVAALTGKLASAAQANADALK